jgi:hypothetical protein
MRVILTEHIGALNQTSLRQTRITVVLAPLKILFCNQALYIAVRSKIWDYVPTVPTMATTRNLCFTTERANSASTA